MAATATGPRLALDGRAELLGRDQGADALRWPGCPPRLRAAKAGPVASLHADRVGRGGLGGIGGVESEPGLEIAPRWLSTRRSHPGALPTHRGGRLASPRARCSRAAQGSEAADSYTVIRANCTNCSGCERLRGILQDDLMFIQAISVNESQENRRKLKLDNSLRISKCHSSDVHEEASVKTGARRLRDFPDIHSASSASAERHERVYGRSHSIPRRRDAPRRTSGCDLGPATDLDLDSLLPAVPVCRRTGVPVETRQYTEIRLLVE